VKLLYGQPLPRRPPPPEWIGGAAPGLAEYRFGGKEKAGLTGGYKSLVFYMAAM